jgi:protease-4
MSPRKRYFILAFFVLGSFVILGGLVVSGLRSFKSFSLSSSDDEDSPAFPTRAANLAVLEITGAIFDSKDTVKKIEELDERREIKAVVVRINSPGGAVGPSQEIYEALKNLRKSKTLVCSFGDLAASGGYYVAAACEKIFANPGTLTGSIGVIMHFMNARELIAWAKLSPELIKAGRYKDIGSGFRPMTDEERQLMQSLVDSVHGQFKKAIVEGRGLSAEKVNEYADGRVFTGEQAKELGFVDELGGERQAINEAAALAKIPGKPKVIRATPNRDRLARWLDSGYAGPAPSAAAPGGAASDALAQSVLTLLGGVAPTLRLKTGVPYLLPPFVGSSPEEFMSSMRGAR